MTTSQLLSALKWEADCLTTIRHEVALHADEPWMSEVSIGIAGFEGLPPDTHVALDVMVADARHRVRFRLSDHADRRMDPAGLGSILFTNIEEMVRTDDWP